MSVAATTLHVIYSGGSAVYYLGVWEEGGRCHLQGCGLDACRIMLQGLQQLLYLLLNSQVAPLLCQDVRDLLQGLQQASA